MAEKLYIEFEGRVLKEEDDGSLSLTFNRIDTLEVAIQVYSDYILSESKLPFNKWLSEELARERELKMKKELGLDEDES